MWPRYGADPNPRASKCVVCSLEVPEYTGFMLYGGYRNRKAIHEKCASWYLEDNEVRPL